MDCNVNTLFIYLIEIIVQCTAHKIVYACSWPAYLINELSDRDYQEIREYCNYWRNYDDIMDSWQSVSSIIDFYRTNVDTFAKYHGPGGWFDADMLLIGNDGLSYEQSKTQMAFWSMWSVPLLMSNDLRTISPEMKRILQNRHVIAIDQDPLGIMAHHVYTKRSSVSSEFGFWTATDDDQCHSISINTVRSNHRIARGVDKAAVEGNVHNEARPIRGVVLQQCHNWCSGNRKHSFVVVSL